MAKKYKYRKKMSKGVKIGLLVSLAVILAGLVAYLLTDRALEKAKENILNGTAAAFTESIGDAYDSCEAEAYDSYNIYQLVVRVKGIKAIGDNAVAGDEAAAEEWKSLSEKIAAAVTKAHAVVAENKEGYYDYVYIVDADDEEEIVMQAYLSGEILDDYTYIDETEDTGSETDNAEG